MRYTGIRIESGVYFGARIEFHRGSLVVTDFFSGEEGAYTRKGPLSVAISESETVMRRIHAPSKAGSVLRKVLPFQIDAQFSLPPERFVFHPLRYDDGDFYVAATSVSQVERLAAAWDPQTITIEQSALLHFASHFFEMRRGICLVYARQEAYLLLYIDRKGQLLSKTFCRKEYEELGKEIAMLVSDPKSVSFVFLGENASRLHVRKELAGAFGSFKEYTPSIPEEYVERCLEIGIALEGADPGEMSVQYRAGRWKEPRVLRTEKWSVFTACAAALILAVGVHFCLKGVYEKRLAFAERSLDEVVREYPTVFSGSGDEGSFEERVQAAERCIEKSRSGSLFFPPKRVLSALLAGVAEESDRRGVVLSSVQYHVETFPHVKKPKERCRVQLTLRTKDDDAKKVKEFSEALFGEEKRFESELSGMRREKDGFILTYTLLF